MSPTIPTSAYTFERPIIIVGAARSGTKLVAKAIRSCPGVTYLNEPTHIWRIGNERVLHDVLPASLATPSTSERIRGIFAGEVEKQQGERFCEKTPANALRLPFVTAVMPEVRIVHIVRDGRNVAVSARGMWHGKNSTVEQQVRGTKARHSTKSLAQRARQRMRTLPLSRLPYYATTAARMFYQARVGKRYSAWGPRIPGMQDLTAVLSLIEVCALQWAWCVELAQSFLTSPGTVPPYLQVRYEDLCADPETHIGRILDFAEVEMLPEHEVLISKVVPERPNKWAQALTEEEQSRVHHLIGHSLATLGYT